MKKGIMCGADARPATVDDIVNLAKKAEAAGFDSLWMANIFSLDAIMTLAIAGRETQRKSGRRSRRPIPATRRRWRSRR